jgi:uncharacterized membrane protein YhaH (DUF805 family)
LRLAWCVVAVVVLLEVALQFFPNAMLLHPVQQSTLFKQASGYTMLTLLVFAIAFGALRRHPALAAQQRRLNDLHQLGGLLILVLLAFHVGQRPSGFLLYTFHAMAIGLGAGALRAVIGRRIGRQASTGLLVLHIGLSCLVAAAVLLHLYFVYAYTA